MTPKLNNVLVGIIFYDLYSIWWFLVFFILLFGQYLCIMKYISCVSDFFPPHLKCQSEAPRAPILSLAKKMTNINDWQPCRDKAAHLANLLCERKKVKMAPRAMRLKMREMKILVLYWSSNACLMHFTQDLNATYGIIQHSRSGLTTLCSVGFQDTLCINSTGVKQSC